MRVRALDDLHDWTFGKGRNNYKRDVKAVAQNIDTRLNSFLGDCFFDQSAGLDWFNLLGAKDLIALNLAISAVILKTIDVTGLIQLDSDLNATTRRFTVRYVVQTSYSTQTGIFTFDTSLVG